MGLSDVAQMIQDSMERDSLLSEWEMEFLESIERQEAFRPNNLSPKQLDTLERIWGKVTKGG